MLPFVASATEPRVLLMHEAHHNAIRRQLLGLVAVGAMCVSACGATSGAPQSARVVRAPTARPRSAPARPQPGVLVFNKGNQVWSERANGTGRKQVLRDTTLDQQPAWSPNGNEIAFVRQVGTGPLQIVIFRISTGQVRALTHADTDSIQPRFSPNGLAVAFVRANHVWILNLETDRVRELWRGTEPAWSSDGKHLAFIRYSNAGGRLLVGDVSAPSHLSVLSPEGWNVATPAYSPNGHSIAFSRVNRLPPRNAKRDSIDLDVLELAGGAAHVVANGDDATNTWPTWSPGSTQIVFQHTVCTTRDGGCTGHLQSVAITRHGVRHGRIKRLGSGGTPDRLQ
jgi:Dipeptidyl peptidase IV (DPP IV) N-terminal region